MTEPAHGIEGLLWMRLVHMAVSEAVCAHTGLLPSCSGKASCCGFESFGFKLYLSSAVRTVGPQPRPFGPCVGQRAAVMLYTCPLLQTLK